MKTNWIFTVVILGQIAMEGAICQTNFIVSPLAYTSVEGVGSHSTAFYQGNQATYMQVHDDLRGRQMAINQIALRRDGPGTQIYPAFSANVSLRISETQVTASQVSTTFRLNHGPQVMTVLQLTNLNFPAAPSSTPSPAPFSYAFPFSAQPFLYGGQGSLCWELWTNTSTQPQTPMTYMDSSFFRRSIFGTGCLATGKTNPFTIYSCITQQPQAASMWMLWIGANQGPANQTLFWMIGTNSTIWGATRLPLNLTPFGAPGCWLYIDPMVILARTTNAAGYFNNQNQPLTFPINPAWAGIRIFHQVAATDPGRNPLPMVFSDGSWCEIPPGPLPFSKVYSYTGVNAATGIVMVSYAAITQFRY